MIHNTIFLYIWYIILLQYHVIIVFTFFDYNPITYLHCYIIVSYYMLLYVCISMTSPYTDIIVFILFRLLLYSPILSLKRYCIRVYYIAIYYSYYSSILLY